MRGWWKVLSVLTTVVLLPAAVFAQSAGASLAGAVKDSSGAVLPGVTVQVSSEALIEKMRETVTDGTGQYRFVDLRPGTYTVTATLTGFNTFKRDNIEVSGTGVITIPVEMKVGAIEETVTVSGETPVVDLQSTTKERVMSKDVVEALPTGRLYNSLGVLIPSVNSSARDVGGNLGDTMASLSAHGGSNNDQRILQNGLNVMTLQTGGGNIGGMVPNTNAAQEVAIDTSAASAERQTGGVSVNFIPRDGGNTIRGSMFATGAYQSQQASNLTQALMDQGLVSLSNYKENWDFNPGVGGPILKDKLWYYYTYRNNGAQTYAAGMFYNQNEFLPNNYQRVPNPSRPGLSAHGDWWDSQMRVTWQMDPKNKFAGTWDQQYYCRCPNGVSSTVSPEAANDRRFPTQQLLHAEWWSPLTSKILIEFVALHRTERWGNMDLRPTDQGGSLDVTPAQYALYPQMIGVTQTAGDSIPGVVFHGPSATFNNNWVPNYTYRWAVSYITGAHAFKVGGGDSFGYLESTNYIPTLDPGSAAEGGIQRPVRYNFNTTLTPNQVTAYETPWSTKVDQNHDMGLFVQDRWTLNRLTLTGGLRYDWYTSESPGQDLGASTLGRPAVHFDGIQHTVNWMDWTPRMAAAYDLQGDGKTAVKVSLNKYVAGQALGGLPSSANPIARLTNSVTRNWNDANGNFVVDCDLSNNAKNGECTNAANAGFGSVTPPPLVDQAIRSAADGGALWNTRGYNWEFSAGVQREILPRVSLDVSYFRRWFGNFTATDQQQVTPADFRSFDVVAPVDARLPGGGGYPVTGYVDFNSVAAATATVVNNVVLTDSIGANQIQHWNGVDVNLNARLQNGLLLQGGTSTGRTYLNNCDVTVLLPETLGNNPQSFCESTEPWLTQVKGVAAYTLPRYDGLPPTIAMVLQNVQLAGTFQSIPGGAKSASYTMSAQATDPRGNELANPAISTLATQPTCTGGAAPGLCNGNSKTVNLLAPTQVYDERQNQVDMRVGKILRFGRTRTSLNFDLFNVFNANTVLTRNNSLSRNLSGNPLLGTVAATPGVGALNQAPQGVVINGVNTANTLWTPTSVLQGRFYKISATFDF